MRSDHDFFNCSEEHELLYVSSLYYRTAEVYLELEKMCSNGEIKYDTHAEVYEKLRKKGYVKK